MMEKVIDRWETLVTLKRNSTSYICLNRNWTKWLVLLSFDLISDKVFELLSDRVFVAHNVNFDYSFVRHELEDGFEMDC
jgi:DNA polymerase-3 subunit epsilon